MSGIENGGKPPNPENRHTEGDRNDQKSNGISCAVTQISDKKRKMKLHPEQIYGLVARPGHTIKEVLKSRAIADVQELPEQLRLFESFYASD